MQSYVVRVYRRKLNNKNEVAGIIEKVGTQHQNSFLSLSELQEFLEHLIKSDYSETKQIDCTARGTVTMREKRSEASDRRHIKNMPRVPFKDSHGTTIKEGRRKIPDRRIGNIQTEQSMRS